MNKHAPLAVFWNLTMRAPKLRCLIGAIVLLILMNKTANSWERSPELREGLISAIHNTNAAVMVTHAENDFGTTAGSALAAELKRLHKLPFLKSILQLA